MPKSAKQWKHDVTEFDIEKHDIECFLTPLCFNERHFIVSETSQQQKFIRTNENKTETIIKH